MTKDDISKLAREAGGLPDPMVFIGVYERFAALVEAHVNAKEKERQRYDIHSCGPDCDRYICVAVRNEREACAQLCDHLWESKAAGAYECATAIRARGQQ